MPPPFTSQWKLRQVEALTRSTKADVLGAALQEQQKLDEAAPLSSNQAQAPPIGVEDSKLSNPSTYSSGNMCHCKRKDDDGLDAAAEEELLATIHRATSQG
eukprot:5314941-Amphidinium_carterae.3